MLKHPKSRPENQFTKAGLVEHLLDARDLRIDLGKEHELSVFVSDMSRVAHGQARPQRTWQPYGVLPPLNLLKRGSGVSSSTQAGIMLPAPITAHLNAFALDRAGGVIACRGA